ncbi:hypothetical protein QJ48_14605 [Paenibacillus sp. A3]|uniref:hypothetical protein n=1 Tax=Paenibacillus sp. A3 TaxID=1337054 RepID=UPI0006D58F83|nr:hypothetical protein [Paenibacillus sp. A3]KPV58749.1 hypothetical protein QJ48_14605 [Paenibacillus sp. A3]
MRTTKRIQAGPAPSMPGHLRFAEQITRKYGFASRNYLGPQALTLLEPGEGDSPVQHVSLVQLTLHLKFQMQSLKQEERDMLRTYRRTLHLLEKLALRYDASERKASSLSPAGGGTASRIAAANSATGTTRADRQESKALRSDVGETKRAFAPTPTTLGAHRHAPTNRESAGSRNSADAGTVQSVSAGQMVHPIRHIRDRGTREPLALRRDYRFAERSGSRHNERARRVRAEQVRQARRKQESKAMAVLRTRDAAAEVREHRDERKRGLLLGPSPGEGRRSPLFEREWRKPEQEQGQAFGRVLEWKRVSLRQQAFNPIHIHRTTQLYSVKADDVLIQNRSESHGPRSRGRLEKASSRVDSDDKRHRTLERNRGRSTGWENRGTAPVAGRSWLRPKGTSSLGMGILLQHGIGLFEAGSLSGHRPPDARLEKRRMTGSRQTDAAAAASEGRLFELGPLRIAGPVKLSATSSVRDNISGLYETVIFSTALIRSVPHSMLMNRYWPSDLSTTTVFERAHRQMAKAGLIYGRAPSLAQRKAGDEASVSLRFRYPMSVSLRHDGAFISRSPGRSRESLGGNGVTLMLAGTVPSTGTSAVEYDSSARSDGSILLRSRMLMSSERLYVGRIAKAENGERMASGRVTAQPKRAGAKTGMPVTSLSGVNIVSPIVLGIRSSAVEGLQFRHHPLMSEGRAASIGPQIYAADSIGALKQHYARRHQASRSASATTRKNARHDAAQGFAGETVGSFTGGAALGSTNQVIRSFTDGAGSGLANIVLRSMPDEIRESEGWGWDSTDVRRHPVVPAQYKQSRFLSVHSFMLHKPVNLSSGGRLSALFPKLTDFAGKIAGSRIALKDGAAEERVMRRHPAGSDATLHKRNSAVYPSASEGSMAPSAHAQFRAVSSQCARTGQAIVFGPPFVQELPGTSTRMAAIIANKLPQVRADWSSAATASALGVLPPRAPQRPLELYPLRADTQRPSMVYMNASGVLSPRSSHRPLQMHPSQANAQRSPAMAASVLAVLPPRAPHRPLELYPSQANAQRSPAMAASVLGVLPPRAPHRPLELYPSQANAQRSRAMAASVLGVLPPRAPQRPLELYPSQADTYRPSAIPSSAPSALLPRAPHHPMPLHLSRADAQRSSAMPANASGVLSPGSPQRTLQLHRPQTDEQRQHAMPASVSGTQPSQAATLPLQLHRSQAVASRPPATPASAAGALTPRVALQAHMARQPAKAAATSSPSYRAARSEIEYHKKQKPDTRTLAQQAAAQAVSQVSAQLEAMKVELSNASQTALPDLDRFVEQVYRELENKIKFERQRSGL